MSGTWVDRNKWFDSSFTTKRGFRVRSRTIRTEALPPSCKGVSLAFNGNTGQLRFEASFPKLIFGHNLSPLTANDFAKAVETIDGIVAWSLTDWAGRPFAQAPSCLNWDVCRADIPFDFRPRGIPFGAALEALLALRPGAGRLHTQVFDQQTALHHNGGRDRAFEICIYNKSAEAAANAPNVAPGRAPIIRIEVRLKNADSVRRALRMEISPTLAELAVPSQLRRVLIEKLAVLGLHDNVQTVVSGLDELVAREIGRAHV